VLFPWGLLVILAYASRVGDLHPKSTDAMEFMRRIAEQELALYDQNRFWELQRGVLLIGQIFEIELELEGESGPKILIGSLEEEDHAPTTRELWADVFAEAAYDGYMLVRIAFSKMETAERCTAFCSVRKPDWLELEVE
jgi:hypothetical protein